MTYHAILNGVWEKAGIAMASYMPQRRIATPADRFTAPVVTDAPRPAFAMPDAESATPDHDRAVPHERVPRQRSRPPVPLFRPDRPAPAAPLPQSKQAPAPTIQQVAAAQTEVASERTPDVERMPRETVAEPVRGMVQARVAVKQVGTGIAPSAPHGGGPPIQRKNVTGLPDGLKAGVEALSAIALDDVRVHYNSAKPAAIGALAYARGTEIHVGPGQEQHLPHEAWHVVQQKQGRVKPTLLAKGLPVNDDLILEQEADAMGARATRAGRETRQRKEDAASGAVGKHVVLVPSTTLQRMKEDAETYVKENMLGLWSVTLKTVTDYIMDTKNHSRKHRTNLRNAWNLNRSPETRYWIPDPDASSDDEGGESESGYESTSSYASDVVMADEYAPAKLPTTFDVTRGANTNNPVVKSFPTIAVSPSAVGHVAHLQRLRPKGAVLVTTHPTEPDLSGEFARGPFASSDFVFHSHVRDEAGTVSRAGGGGSTFHDLAKKADAIVRRLMSVHGLTVEKARQLVSEELYRQTRGGPFDARIPEGDREVLFEFGQALLADKARASQAHVTLQEFLGMHDRTFADRFPADWKKEYDGDNSRYPGAASGGRGRLEQDTTNRKAGTDA